MELRLTVLLYLNKRNIFLLIMAHFIELPGLFVKINIDSVSTVSHSSDTKKTTIVFNNDVKYAYLDESRSIYNKFPK